MLSQTGMHALRAMGYLAIHRQEEPVLAQTIAEQTGIPKNFLSKILNRLVQGGVVVSTRGRKGGFLLSRPASRIFLKDVVELFMKMEDFKSCFLGLSACHGGCGLHDQWHIIAKQFEKLLTETTVDQIGWKQIDQPFHNISKVNNKEGSHESSQSV